LQTHDRPVLHFLNWYQRSFGLFVLDVSHLFLRSVSSNFFLKKFNNFIRYLGSSACLPISRRQRLFFFFAPRHYFDFLYHSNLANLVFYYFVVSLIGLSGSDKIE
jgi:hypothetical protein